MKCNIPKDVANRATHKAFCGMVDILLKMYINEYSQKYVSFLEFCADIKNIDYNEFCERRINNDNS